MQNQRESRGKVRILSHVWMMGWKVWTIPIGLGIISTVIDLVYFQSELKDDLQGWIMTVLCILIALGAVKKVIPIINNNYMLGAWIIWVVSVLVWLARLFLRISFHFHI